MGEAWNVTYINQPSILLYQMTLLKVTPIVLGILEISFFFPFLSITGLKKRNLE